MRTTNPYVVQLVEATRAAGVDVAWLSWRRALLGRWDVLHVHWPDILIRRGRRTAQILAQARFAALLSRVTVLRTPIIRTLHNVDPHERGDVVERALLRWCERRTTGWILLNPHTPLPRPGPSWVIPHGHYRDWYSGLPSTPSTPGRFLMFGLLRAYKGTDELLAAFAALPRPELSMRIAGRPDSGEMREMVTAAAAADPRLTAELDYLADERLAAEIGAAALVVLPYRVLHNSGALLLALSLDRPVLVRRSESAADLAAEVGPGWVRMFDGPLTADVLAAAMDEGIPADPPDLSARDWKPLGLRHAEVYREALGTGRR